MEDELDEVVEDIVLLSERPESEIVQDKGKAQGIAWCIALILKPYYPEPDKVRDAAMQRFFEKYPQYADEEDED